jgi:hypothetical protein
LAVVVAFTFIFAPIGGAAFPIVTEATTMAGSGSESSSSTAGCELNSARGQIQHVIYIQFDNVHFTRDNPNVPSDLEQMPNLLNFITNNGVLMTNHHTPLASIRISTGYRSPTLLIGSPQQAFPHSPPGFNIGRTSSIGATQISL